MENIFKTSLDDINTLTRNVNCFTTTTPKDYVMLVKYKASDLLNKIDTSPITYQTSLKVSYPSDYISLFAYLNIKTETTYTFRIINSAVSSNTLYPSECIVNINTGGNTVINKANTSSGFILRKGRYLLNIYIPQNTSTIFNLEYKTALDATYYSVDNLLLKDCTGFKTTYPIRQFLLDASTYCGINDNINTSDCITLYNEYETSVLNEYLNS